MSRKQDRVLMAKEICKVSHIFVKQNDEKKYKEVLYKGNNFSMEEIPNEIKQMIVETKE